MPASTLTEYFINAHIIRLKAQQLRVEADAPTGKDGQPSEVEGQQEAEQLEKHFAEVLNRQA